MIEGDPMGWHFTSCLTYGFPHIQQECLMQLYFQRWTSCTPLFYLPIYFNKIISPEVIKLANEF